MEQELDHYQMLFRRIPVMAAAMDGRGFFLDQSDVLIARLGYSREAFVSLRPTDIADAASIKRIEKEMVPQLRRTGSVNDVPVTFLNAQQQPVSLVTSAIVEHDADGNYLRTIAVYRDADAAEEVAEYYLAMYRATPAMLHTVDAHGYIANVSNHWLRKLGYEREEVLGRSILEFMPPSQREQLGDQHDIEQMIAAGDFENEQRRLRTRDGRVLELLMSSVSDRDATGAVVRMLVASKDVTARNEAERALRRLLDENAVLRAELEAERDYLREEVKVSMKFGQVVGESPALRAMMTRIEAVAATPASVLIQGESGVGKELVAREIHERSSRHDQPLVKVNCASIPEDLFESEFFGHVKGAFTGAHRDRIGRFQLADGGTLFLDEVGEIPLDLQGKLLRVLQENEFERVGDDRTRKVDVRVVAATNRDLREAVADGLFREDLYYRLSVFPIDVPPLRERADDVVHLAQHFLAQTAKDFGRNVPPLNRAEVNMLRAYSWPGNVRELKNVIERAVILSRGDKLRFDLTMPESVAIHVTETKAQSGDAGDVMTEAEIRALMRRNTIAALEARHWRVSGPNGAANLLGLKPSTLSDRIRKMGLTRPDSLDGKQA
ncbi:MAG: sigma 54-interacting transcriptional regulator, partial [Pseudomonadota bacterium]